MGGLTFGPPSTRRTSPPPKLSARRQLRQRLAVLVDSVQRFVHSAEQLPQHLFGPAQLRATARPLFIEIVGERPGTEVRVDGRQVPYAREIWLPLFWLFVGDRS